ncbi:MAG: hypothetical protein ACE5FT_02805 [Candidatus Nanoarchaeia archaeon]
MVRKTMKLYWRNLKYFWWTTSAEKNALAVVIFVFALISTFNQWGTEEFSAVIGITNLLWTMLAIGLSFMLVDAVRRLWVLSFGMQYELRVSWYYFGIGLLLTAISGGGLKVFIGPTFWLKAAPGQEHGRYWRRTAISDFAYVGLLGIIVHFLLADLAVIGYFSWLPQIAVDNMITFNLIYAILAILPIPPLDGSKIFYWFFGTAGGWFAMPGIIIGMLSGYGLGWVFGASMLGRYALALLGAIAMLTYWERMFPHPQK